MKVKRADTFVTYLEGVFRGHFLDIVVVDFCRVSYVTKPEKGLMDQ